ncbi:hypothetical protein F5Y12DRAFT_139239 [Xylaria sp. FL1777]|nr:hypothetical protein F5Y12DRAFT_139239 [Xylaria sp. FL1777]
MAYFAKAKSIWQATRTFLRRVQDYNSGGYIHCNDFADVGITCSTLDLRSGKSSHGTVFIKPLSIEKLHSIFTEQQVFSTQHLSNILDGWNIYDALEVANLIKHYMFFSNNMNYDGLIYEESTWQIREIDWKGGEELLHDDPDGHWRAEFIFDQIDNNTPHVSPVLIDNLPLHEDSLSLAEMCCILLCTARRIRNRGYHCHRVIPVTVISLSGRSARVVHGYVDVSTNSLRIIKSPILELNKENTNQKIELLVSWCLGQPIGSTK